MRSGVAFLSGALGLPKEFVECWFDVEFCLGRLARKTVALRERLAGMPGSASGRGELIARLNRQVDRIEIIAPKT
jgi:hypothetical protein